MDPFLLAAFTVTCVFAFVLLVYPAVMSLVWRVLDRLFGEREDLP